MEMILDSLADQSSEAEYLKYWEVTEPISLKDYLLHEFTVYYWKDMTNEFERSSQMIPAIRKLIAQYI